MNFFDQYPEYYREKGVNSFPNRLNRRYEALIENNKELIIGKKILDIASTDGRWTFAAIKNGADHVIGIELSPQGVKIALEIMEKYNITKEKYQFIIGDIHQEIKKIETNSVDTVFFFGFFYHTMYHMDLLKEIKRLNPNYIIFDSHISQSDSPVIDVFKNVTKKGEKILEGYPSKSALEIMLEYFGYSFEYYDWKKKNIDDWDHLGDYKNEKRITLIAKRN